MVLTLCALAFAVLLVNSAAELTQEKACDWSSWSLWTQCDQYCTKSRERTCPCSNCGTGSYVDVQLCPFKSCTPSCTWTPWSAWSACTSTCGSGEKSRNRACACATSYSPKSEFYAVGIPDDCGGGLSIDVEECGETCVRPASYWAEYNAYASGEYEQPWPYSLEHSQFFCERGTWLDVSSSLEDTLEFQLCKEYIAAFLNKAAGANVDQISTTIDKTEVLLSLCESDIDEEEASFILSELSAFNEGRMGPQACNDNPCCFWSEWTDWSGCGSSCQGSKFRSRPCHCPGHIPPLDFRYEVLALNLSNSNLFQLNKFVSDGLCSGEIPIDIAPCDPIRCCKWKDWNEWGVCSTTCGDGIQTRKKLCDCPTGTGSCPDSPPTESRECNEGPCDGECSWSKWSDWSDCEQIICGGSQNRSKSCLCKGTNTITCYGETPEESRACPECCQWGEWSPWSTCSVMCGGGKRFRQPNCNCISIDRKWNSKSLCGIPELQYEVCNTFSCTMPMGIQFWKSMSARVFEKSSDVKTSTLTSWPVPESTKFTCGEEGDREGEDFADQEISKSWSEIMQLESDNPHVVLAQEYITTVLNYKNGAKSASDVDGILPSVQEYLNSKLCDIPINSENSTQNVQEWTSKLRNYNNEGDRGMGDNNLTFPNPRSPLSHSDSLYLAIPIGVMAVVAIFLCCFSTLKKYCDRKGAKKISLRDLSSFYNTKQV